MQYWQQSAGDGDRNYIDVCLKWGVILNGPSRHGAWTGELSRQKYSAQGTTQRKCTDLDRFYSGMKDGDLVVLRLGTREIYGIGIVRGNYSFHEAFSDVDGWDIAHVRRVTWLWRDLRDPRTFETYALNQGDTTQLLPDTHKSKPIRDWIDEIYNSRPNPLPDLPPLPSEQIRPMDLKVACKPLYDCGLSTRSVSDVHDRMTDLAQLARWYRDFAPGVSEAETVAQLVTPLLSALGWSPQTLAMEWSPGTGGRIDLAAFRPFRGKARQDNDISLIVEAKKLDSSCLKGFEQARDYSQTLKNCERCVVTDGMRYAIFVRKQDSNDSGDFEETPRAYLNLLDPKDSYPVFDSSGADEALLLLSPNWHAELLKDTA
jgi:hypothetical protein